MYRSGNPALSDSTFSKSGYKDVSWWEDYESNMMTIEGVTEKTGLLLLITAATAILTAFSMPESALLALIGAIVGFILALVIIFSGSSSPFLI
ncbi:MAG: Bax inhibitor-1/YccA family protein, partial [Candidatus Thermoplasmatota archaeon]|nr:Bax inhibitor-1/YccA family protein [Candidatus Thermoplasmatota archaeon]